jgi:hypothetical protein
MKKKSPVFPFRVITAWIHPSEVTTCEACKQPGNIYTIDNYIPLVKMVGTTAYTKLSNDPWIEAIKEQAREQYEVALTSHECVSCLNIGHIKQYGESQTWTQTLDALTQEYGQVSLVYFISVNSYEDEGVTFWGVCDVPETILEVSDYVQELSVPPHETRETTREDIQGIIQDAMQLGAPVKIIRPDKHGKHDRT